jgi:hypothetical protein
VSGRTIGGPEAAAVIGSGNRTRFRSSQHLGGVPFLTRGRDLEAAVLPAAAQTHAEKPPQAGIVRQTGRAARIGAKVHAVQRGPATGLKIGL